MVGRREMRAGVCRKARIWQSRHQTVALTLSGTMDPNHVQSRIKNNMQSIEKIASRLSSSFTHITEQSRNQNCSRTKRGMFIPGIGGRDPAELSSSASALSGLPIQKSSRLHEKNSLIDDFSFLTFSGVFTTHSTVQNFNKRSERRVFSCSFIWSPDLSGVEHVEPAQRKC